MVYDEELAHRIRAIVTGSAGVTEKVMFGGLAFLLNRKMFCGIVGSDLMVRVGAQRYEQELSRAHVRPMDFTGRPMRGYVFVAPAGFRTRAQLSSWVRRGLDQAASLSSRR